MQTTLPTFATRFSDPVDDLDTARRMVAEARLFEQADMQPHWPLTTAEVVDLLVADHLDTSVENLEELVTRRIVKAPGRDDDGECALESG